MSKTGQEIEAKFYLSNADKMRTRLHALQARLIQARLLERNLRFDLPDRSLSSAGRVLRLRQDSAARLTYKGASQNREGVLARQEIEMIVEEFEKARQFLEALGYRKTLYYEKYRTTFELDQALVMLDEMPYGNFVEVEGASVEQIQAVSGRLGLNWAAATGTSYSALFQNIRKTLELPFYDITFADFEGINVTPGDLSVAPADE